MAQIRLKSLVFFLFNISLLLEVIRGFARKKKLSNKCSNTLVLILGEIAEMNEKHKGQGKICPMLRFD